VLPRSITSRILGARALYTSAHSIRRNSPPSSSNRRNLTLVVDNLERCGFVVRQRRATDRRYVRVALTPKGRRASPSFSEARHAAHGEFAVLSAREQATLGRL